MTKEKTIESVEICLEMKSCDGCAYHGYGSPKCINTMLRDLLSIVKDSDKSTSTGVNIKKPAAYPADLMEHRHSGLLEED